MTALTDAIDQAITCRQTHIDAIAAFNTARIALDAASVAFEVAKQEVVAELPPDLLTYEYVDSNSNKWGITRDDSVTLRQLNALPN